jgi:hypothetical protein
MSQLVIRPYVFKTIRSHRITSTAIPKYVHKTWLLNLFADYEFPNKQGIYFGIEALVIKLGNRSKPKNYRIVKLSILMT